MKTIFVNLILILFLVACNAKNRDLMVLPEEAKQTSLSVPYKGQVEVKLNNRVDIVMVMDTSSSMNHHIQSVSDNINKFVSSLAGDPEKQELKIRIGVTSVWDEFKFNYLLPRRAKDFVKVKNIENPVELNLGLKDLKNKKYLANFDIRKKPFALGEFRPVKDKNNNYNFNQSRILSNYVGSPLDFKNTTVNSDFVKNLASTINIGTEAHQCYEDSEILISERKNSNLTSKTDKHDQQLLDNKLSDDQLDFYNLNRCGAENEEIFSPMEAILTRAKNQWKQAKTDLERAQVFPSPDAKSVIFIVISDAEDNVRQVGKGISVKDGQFVYQTPAVSTQSLINQMSDFMSDKTNSVQVYGAINYVDPKNNCLESGGRIDQSAKFVHNDEVTETALKEEYENKFAEDVLELIKATKGKAFNICSNNYYQGLTQFGENIRKTVLSSDRIKIILNSIPEAGTLKIFYNGKEIPQDLTQSEIGWRMIDTATVVIGTKTAGVNFNAPAKFTYSMTTVGRKALLGKRAKNVNEK